MGLLLQLIRGEKKLVDVCRERDLKQSEGDRPAFFAEIVTAVRVSGVLSDEHFRRISLASAVVAKA